MSIILMSGRNPSSPERIFNAQLHDRVRTVVDTDLSFFYFFFFEGEEEARQNLFQQIKPGYRFLNNCLFTINARIEIKPIDIQISVQCSLFTTSATIKGGRETIQNITKKLTIIPSRIHQWGEGVQTMWRYDGLNTIHN